MAGRLRLHLGAHQTYRDQEYVLVPFRFQGDPVACDCHMNARRAPQHPRSLRIASEHGQRFRGPTPGKEEALDHLGPYIDCSASHACGLAVGTSKRPTSFFEESSPDSALIKAYSFSGIFPIAASQISTRARSSRNVRRTPRARAGHWCATPISCFSPLGHPLCPARRLSPEEKSSVHSFACSPMNCTLILLLLSPVPQRESPSASVSSTSTDTLARSLPSTLLPAMIRATRRGGSLGSESRAGRQGIRPQVSGTAGLPRSDPLPGP